MADIPSKIYFSLIRAEGVAPALPPSTEEPTSPVNPPGVTPVNPVDHNSTLNKQGGDEVLSEFYHLTAEELQKVQNLAGVALSGNHSDLNLDDGRNPHGTTKSDIGLGNVDNTSDLNKPISNATWTALNQKANTADLAEVARTGDYEDLINTPEPFFDLDFTWEFDGNKNYTFPSAFELIRINWVSLFGIILPKDNIAYTVNPTAKTLTLGSLYTPSNRDKLIISARLINA